MSRPWTKFDYLYRDADNHKAFGSIALIGEADAERWNMAVGKFSDGSCFTAEQLAIPSLCQQLFQWSGGAPTDVDHCWHEYAGHSVVDGTAPPDGLVLLGLVENFIDRIIAIESWDIWLSPSVRAF
jgi:hypothetical protein